MRCLAFAFAVLACACSSDGGLPDLTASPDLHVLAPPPDLAVDLQELPPDDLAAPDLAPTVDLAGPPDLWLPPLRHLSFGKPTTVVVDKITFAWDLVAADFNRDGHADLAVSSTGNQALAILLGKGDGTFAPTIYFPLGDAPYALDNADLDRDGRPDVVVQFDKSVAALVGKGDGSFRPPVVKVVGTTLGPISGVDFSGDGRGDLTVVEANTGAVNFFVSDGLGGFRAPVRLDSSPGTGDFLGVGDLDQDGRLDLAVPIDLRFSLHFNQGFGQFSVEQLLDCQLYSGPVVVNDLDGDGQGDLAMAAPDVLRTYKGMGVRQMFVQGVDVATGLGAHDLTAADLDRDGDLDLAGASAGGRCLFVMRNAGQLVFEAPVQLPVAGLAQGVVMADFNSDGTPDVAGTVDGAVVLFLNTSH